MAQQGQEHDPPANFKFGVYLGDSLVALATKVSGLGGTLPVTAYQPGNDPSGPTYLPEPAVYPDVVIESALMNNADIDSWFRSARDARADGAKKGDVREVQITLRNPRTDKQIVLWKLRDVQVIGYEIGDLDANSGAVLVNRIVLKHRGFGHGIGS